MSSTEPKTRGMSGATQDLWIAARSKYQPVCGADVVWFAQSGWKRLARRLAMQVIGEGS